MSQHLIRFARWVLEREEQDRWVPQRLLIWAFYCMFKHGTPAIFPSPSTYVVAAHPLIEINPGARTWGTPVRVSNVTTTWPLSSDNPYA